MCGPSHFRRVTSQIVSNNLRAGVTKACFYEPAVNRTYAEMAAHYGTAAPREAARQGQGRSGGMRHRVK
jgi:hypothetical protein